MAIFEERLLPVLRLAVSPLVKKLLVLAVCYLVLIDPEIFKGNGREMIESLGETVRGRPASSCWRRRLVQHGPCRRRVLCSS